MPAAAAAAARSGVGSPGSERTTSTVGEKRVADRALDRAVHGDPLVARLVAVADGAEPEHVAGDRVLEAAHRRHAVDDAGGEDDEARLPAPAVLGGGVEELALALDERDAPLDDRDPVLRGLGAEAID